MKTTRRQLLVEINQLEQTIQFEKKFYSVQKERLISSLNLQQIFFMMLLPAFIVGWLGSRQVTSKNKISTVTNSLLMLLLSASQNLLVTK